MAIPFSVSDLGKHLVERSAEGLSRVRAGFFQSLQIVMSGIGAYAFAQYILGHREPIFAATAAIVSLGYVRGSTHARRMLEVTLGVTIGILIGDSLMLLLGRGLWQAGLVMFISISVARFLDNGIIFTIQMGLQSCLVVLMAPTLDGPFARSLDAIVGGIFAFLLMFLFPKDPRTSPRRNAEKLIDSFSEVLRNAARSMREYNSDGARQALEQARDLQPLYSAAEGDVVTAKGMVKLSMVGRRHGVEIDELAQILSGVDLAIRNTRVLNRRMASTISHVQITDDAIESIADTIEQIAEAVTTLGESVAQTNTEDRAALKLKARKELALVAGILDPSVMGVRTLEAESLILMIRPLVIDLLEATGLTHDEAVPLLIELGESMTEHAPRTTEMPIIRPQKRVVNSFAQEDKNEHEGLKPQDTRALNVVLRHQQKRPNKS